MALPPLPMHGVTRQLTGTSDAVGDSLIPTLTGGLGVGLPSAAGGYGGAGSAPARYPFEVRVAGVTDPGVAGKQNQDDFFVWESFDRQTVIIGVFDGHGREMGQVAARAASEALQAELTRPAVLEALHVTPGPILVRAFAAAHAAIEAKCKKTYEDLGCHVYRSPEGHLVRTHPSAPAPRCINGGTTATVVILLEGRRLIVSNVGDSTAIIAGLGAEGVLKPIDKWAPLPSSCGGSKGAAASLANAGPFAATAPPSSAMACPPAAPVPALPRPASVPAAVASSYLELSADHSPESPSEFLRIRGLRPATRDPTRPELLFVYDTLTASKLMCPPIFEVDPASGALTKTERGSYYKNVRCEWATLVATPSHAPFQDALAFTRSLGDLHLQTYGVSHEPETWWLDLVKPDPSSGAPSETPLVGHPIAVVACSDGIWDNWKFEETAAFALEEPRLASVLRTGSAQPATNELMAHNLVRANANFGSSADNMTAVTMYLLPRV